MAVDEAQDGDGELAGAAEGDLEAGRWGIALAGAERRRSLVATFPKVGDTEPGERYDAASLGDRPMITWCPPGRSEERFTIALVARRASADGEAGKSGILRLLWLVVDIPGLGPDEAVAGDAEVGSGCYGLAGNCDAVDAGSEVMPFEAPDDTLSVERDYDGGELLVLLFAQLGVAPLAPKLHGLQREPFDITAYVESQSLGAALAAEVVRLRAPGQGTTSGRVGTKTQKPMSLSCGGDLNIDSSEPLTLTASLWRTGELRPDRGLTIYDVSGGCHRLAYSTLRARAGCVAAGLGESGLAVGSGAALLQVPPLAEHFVAFWGCLLSRVRPVAVAIPPNYADGAHAVCLKIWNVWQLLDEPPILTTKAHAENVELLREARSMASMRLLLVDDLEAAAAEAPAVRTLALAVEPSEVAFYQLSSGSTGVPKCIQIAHRGVVFHIHGEAQYCGVGPDDVHLSFLPVDHVVPILTVHCCDVYHGCEEVQADVSWFLADPMRWLRLVAEHRATRTWSPNFAFKLVADALKKMPDLDEAIDVSCCRYWMNAGEQVTMPVCEEFLEQTSRFGVRRSFMQPAFGMAEACTCMTYNNEFDIVPAARLDRSIFINLGPPVPGVEIRIADADDCTLPEEVVGRFQIRGAVITPGYLKNPEANEAAFVGDGWFNTGDVGFVKGGRLYLTGREKEMIIIRGANFYCYEVEDVVNVLGSVTPTFTAAVSAHDPTTGTEGLAIFFVPQGSEAPTNDAISAIRTELTRRMGLKPSFIIPLAREEFPKTTSGKIQRSDLAKALRAGKFDGRVV